MASLMGPVLGAIFGSTSSGTSTAASSEAVSGESVGVMLESNTVTEMLAMPEIEFIEYAEEMNIALRDLIGWSALSIMKNEGSYRKEDLELYRDPLQITQNGLLQAQKYTEEVSYVFPTKLATASLQEKERIKRRTQEVKELDEQIRALFTRLQKVQNKSSNQSSCVIM